MRLLISSSRAFSSFSLCSLTWFSFRCVHSAANLFFHSIHTPFWMEFYVRFFPSPSVFFSSPPPRVEVFLHWSIPFGIGKIQLEAHDSTRLGLNALLLAVPPPFSLLPPGIIGLRVKEEIDFTPTTLWMEIFQVFHDLYIFFPCIPGARFFFSLLVPNLFRGQYYYTYFHVKWRENGGEGGGGLPYWKVFNNAPQRGYD